MRKAIVYASVHHGITLIFEQKENRGFYSSVFRLLCFSLQLEKYVSVIERGLKVTKLDTFVTIANALDVSADTLLIDVVAHSVTGVTNELTEKIEKLPIKEQKKMIKVIHTLLEE